MNEMIVTYEGHTYNIKPIFGDMVRVDEIRHRLKLPTMDEAQFQFMALVAYSALVRVGTLDPKTTDPRTFSMNLENLENVEDDDADEKSE
ncbi:hypothetical protein [Zhihengliuella halotolerans]|uniref:Phage protein n=1 Tax=Zhihengliuella halotolerans TaxID=370736 RepID=A0A4Q8AD50_9MICC|nr:hypothetical protein [Zhihengliuella halotolerans]RZU61449.1 hypothetical protein EV380_1019 [Zhihengliuella halotolerans]